MVTWQNLVAINLKPKQDVNNGFSLLFEMADRYFRPSTAAGHFQSVPPWDFPPILHAAPTSVRCTLPATSCRVPRVKQLCASWEVGGGEGCAEGCDRRETMTLGPKSVFRLSWPVSSVVQRFQRRILTAVAAGRAGQLRCHLKTQVKSLPK